VAVQFRVLGPVEVGHEDDPVGVRPVKERALLAMLLLARGRGVSIDRLIDALWGDNVPTSATRSLRVHVSRLRQSLGDLGGRVVTRPPGYALTVEEDEMTV
jgi:DNA-binding SARP family transcriptional activator